MSEAQLAVSDAKSARHRVRNGVEDMILKGDFESGTKLKQSYLADKFGVGQGVVREALLELRAMGLVESVDNRGIYVTQINDKKLIDAIEGRTAVESIAVRLCCENSSRADQLELQRMVDEIDECFHAGNEQKGALLDREFHHELVKMSGNGELLRVTDSYRAFGKVIQLSRSPDVVYSEHCEIVAAIRHRDADRAEKMIRLHVEAAKKTLEERLRTDPNFVPKWVN